MYMTIEERRELKMYLRMQIAKIRKILELRKLQTLCKLKKLSKMVATKFNIEAGLENKSLDGQINYLIKLITGQVGLLLMDYYII